MIEKEQVAWLHGPNEITRLIIAHAIPPGLA
jgi:hypothetical protein